MKQCPQCQQLYEDESLNFCLSDGTTLISASNPSSEKTVIITPHLFKQPQQSVKSGVNPVFAYITVGLLALIAGGAIIMWTKYDPNTQTNSGFNTSSSKDNNKNIEQEKTMEGKNLKQEQAKPEKNPQIPSNQNTVIDPEKVQSYSPTNSPPSGTWFVILGSYQRYETEKANQRLQHVQGLGYSASILDTDNYPKLTGNLLIVAMGPYSKSYARSLAAQIKSKGAEAYIKAGW
jgi:cell division septation protein DedD